MVLRRKSSDNVMENDRGGEKSAHALSGFVENSLIIMINTNFIFSFQLIFLNINKILFYHNDKFPVNIFVMIQFQL